MCRCLCLALLLVAPALAQASDVHEVSGSYWYVVDHITQVDADARVRLWLSLPGDRPGQEVRIRNIRPKPTEILVDPDHGNRVAYWDVSPHDGDEILYFRYEFDARLGPVRTELDPAAVRPPDTESALYRRYTAPGELIGLDDEIAAVARRIAGGEASALTRAGRLFDWMVEHLEFMPNDQDARTALETLQSRQGDCGQLSRLFVSMCRSLGIPARPVVTHWLDAGLHHLAEFHLPPYGWVPVDISVAQVFLPGHAYFSPEESVRFAADKGIPETTPRWLFGNAPATQMVLAVGADLVLDSDLDAADASFAVLAPGGDMAVPSAIDIRGLGDAYVSGGFMAWGEVPTEDEAHELAHQMLVDRFVAKGLYDVAELGCLQLQVRDPDDVVSWINLGLVKLHKRDYDGAEACFNRALRGHAVGRIQKLESVIWAHNYLGNCYDLMGRREMAVAQYAQVVEMDNDYRGAVGYARDFLGRPFTETDFR